jgi:guanine deaminase
VAMDQETIDISLLSKAIALAVDNVASGQRPFGALLSRGEDIVALAVNGAARTCDPTEHAEIAAIRAATNLSGSESLDGLTLYASCEPCCMCASAIRWAGIQRVVFALTREEAEEYGFRDVVGAEVSRAILGGAVIVRISALDDAARAPFDGWKARGLSGS